MGQAVDEWNVSIGDLKISGVEFEYLGDILRIFKKNTEEIRDYDHDLVHEIFIDVRLPRLKYCDSGHLEFEGFVQSVCRYPEGESIPTDDENCPGGAYCRVGTPHPMNNKWIPPKDEDFRPGIWLIHMRRS